MRALTSVLFIVGLVLLLLGTYDSICAQDQHPGINITLNFDKESFAYGESVGVTVEVKNVSGGDIWIAPEGFSSKVFYRHLWIYDPTGRLLQLKPMGNPPEGSPPPEDSQVESPDAPPLPWVVTPGGMVRAAFCESLDAGWESAPWQKRTEDLREHYALELPGYYLFHVEIPVTIFTTSPCNINQPLWSGRLKSDPQSIYIQGSTQVKVIPNKWHLKWKEEGKKEKHVKVEILPEAGKTVDDYQLESIRLNNLEALKVKASRSKIKVSFSRKEAIESLGAVEVGKSYPVVISGRLKNGLPFGGGQKIRIVR